MDNKIEITPSDTPWEIACMLINAKYPRKDIFGREAEQPFFTKSDLRRIGEHLVNYSNTEEEKKVSVETFMS